MMWMVDIQGFRQVTISIAYFFHLSLSYYLIFAAVPWRIQSPFSQKSEFDSLNSPSWIPGQIIIEFCKWILG